jgi:hypothetical protein
MPYYCNFNGTGGFTSPTLGNLITGSPKIKVVIKKFSFLGTDTRNVFWQGGLTASLREFIFRRNGSTNFEIYIGGTANTICTVAAATTAYGTASMTCDEWAFELDGTTARLYKDGAVVVTKTGVTRGTGRLNGSLFRLGCGPSNDTAGDTTSAGYNVANSTFGDVSVYINDVLVRELVIPSTSTSIPDSVSGNSASQTGTWPGDDSEWIFYDAGGTSQRMKYYNGTAWVAKPLKYYNGSAWVEKPIKYHNGTSWV